MNYIHLATKSRRMDNRPSETSNTGRHTMFSERNLHVDPINILMSRNTDIENELEKVMNIFYFLVKSAQNGINSAQVYLLTFESLQQYLTARKFNFLLYKHTRSKKLEKAVLVFKDRSHC